MYYEPTDRAAACRASDLIEELGQVEFIFSDKTGTLTCNEMEFRKCGINSRVYGTLNGKIGENDALIQAINDKSHSEHEHAKKFVLLLALCNSVFPAKYNEGEIIYQASSPDELALVEAAKSLGYVLKERNDGKIFLEIDGQSQV